MATLARLARVYHEEVRDLDQEPRLIATLSFLVTFLATRLVTHFLLDTGGGGGLLIGSVHIHHMVFGIVLLLATGAIALLDRVERVRAIFFGIGAALVLDEFALILNLADVYWAPQGRESIDAVVIFRRALARARDRRRLLAQSVGRATATRDANRSASRLTSLVSAH